MKEKKTGENKGNNSGGYFRLSFFFFSLFLYRNWTDCMGTAGFILTFDLSSPPLYSFNSLPSSHPSSSSSAWLLFSSTFIPWFSVKTPLDEAILLKMLGAFQCIKYFLLPLKKKWNQFLKLCTSQKKTFNTKGVIFRHDLILETGKHFSFRCLSK